MKSLKHGYFTGIFASLEKPLRFDSG